MMAFSSLSRLGAILVVVFGLYPVIASEAKQSSFFLYCSKAGLLRRKRSSQ